MDKGKKMERCSRVLGVGIVMVMAIIMAKISTAEGHVLDSIQYTASLESIKKLELKKGDTHAILAQIKVHLQRLGYAEAKAEKENGLFDERLEAAVRLYQRSFNLPVTGILDGPTIHSISVPRCGREDAPLPQFCSHSAYLLLSTFFIIALFTKLRHAIPILVSRIMKRVSYYFDYSESH
ncbi:hypothetical protein SUGI_0933550 [Cryptomeria japonica]|nr:hypothetical protein SUGI_0933550 [Cryptomeria japonica]